MATETTYAYLDTRVDQIQARMLNDGNLKSGAYLNTDRAKADLDTIGADNAQVSTDINTQAAANPADEAWQSLKARKDLLISEFQVQSTDMDGLIVAMEPFRPTV